MDHEVRTKHAAAEYGTRPSGASTGRKLARAGTGFAFAAVALLGRNLLTAHRAAAQLEADTGAQAYVYVAVTKPEPLTEDTELVLPGNLQANYEAPIYARTTGYLKRWRVDIGTRVKAGQVLGEIEAPEVDQQLRQAEAGLASAAANLKIAQITAERWRNLRDTDSVSKQDADEKVSQAAATEAQVRAARANVQRLRDLSGFEKVIAPFDGVVTARHTDVGQLINAGSETGPELFTVADVRQLRLYVRVPQTYAVAMQPGIAAELQFPERPGKSYTGKLDRTSSAIDAASRTLLAQLIIDNSNGELLPGAYAEVHFKLPAAGAGRSFKLPANVLLFRGDGLHVATVGAHEHVVLKAVELGRDYGSEIEIVHGLERGDNVILSPPDSLTDGSAVRVSNPTAERVAKS